MRKNRWWAKALLSVSLASFWSVSLAKTTRQDIQTSEQIGVASYYSDKFQGKLSASGGVYDVNGLTAAHANLPFGTTLLVTNVKNQRSVTVRITERPAKSNHRLLDLSKRAAQELGMIRDGIAKVKIEILEMG
ncbi:MAG: septal ring lytic transglycosylase RlpA family protein [Methylomonas sp.]|nr:septal ring lytic transglycosylase RlpA family protein [Methylomonas sp.]PPD21033.1 MAG: septal ring lytic transglycosylase RlpA family lipoprotein [Methylomonas sp.]PPD27060.1 MAG: septal ring lytic transglycosylase RlpA family lipoprotein [Methylomonas sp.]PPD38993.1 MAG: septal ring lytic transglycosylase RlpA family lipoprotein [Methylomonas sp.]PPD40887.1 MAG: septal ring lytic transglycosylase RlpA family lipoprotein [Methylomonas sp.]